MKLYITPASPYARMTRIVVIEKGLESRIEIITAQTRHTDSPYYKVNPSGRVPYLIRDDNVGLEESAVICVYLDQLDGKPVFDLPTGEQQWEGRRLEALARSMLDGLTVWVVRLPGRKTSNHRPSFGTKQIAANEWPICGSGRSIIH